MSEGKRPGGLTAMAVINFVFGGWDLLNGGGSLAFVMIEKPKELQPYLGELYTLYGLTLLLAVLLITSGIGYIKQRKTLGRGVGNAYAVFSLISTAYGTKVALAMGDAASQVGRPVLMVLAVLGAVYPILTLIMLNLTFKEDFVR